MSHAKCVSWWLIPNQRLAPGLCCTLAWHYVCLGSHTVQEDEDLIWAAETFLLFYFGFFLFPPFPLLMSEQLQKSSSNSPLHWRLSLPAPLCSVLGLVGKVRCCSARLAVPKQSRFMYTSCYWNLIPYGFKLGKTVPLGGTTFKAWSPITSTPECQGVTEMPGLWSVQNRKSIRPGVSTQWQNKRHLKYFRVAPTWT